MTGLGFTIPTGWRMQEPPPPKVSETFLWDQHLARVACEQDVLDWPATYFTV